MQKLEIFFCSIQVILKIKLEYTLLDIYRRVKGMTRMKKNVKISKTRFNINIIIIRRHKSINLTF